MKRVNALIQRYWLNLGLLGLGGGLAALALFEPGREPPADVPPLLEWASAQIDRIAVERPGQESLAFEQRAGRWWMTAPEIGPAHPVLIHRMTALAEARCTPSYAAAALDLPRLRLEPPRLRLWLNGQEIRFGDVAPLDNQRYVQVGATVYLCSDQWYPLLNSATGSFLAMPWDDFPK